MLQEGLTNMKNLVPQEGSAASDRALEKQFL